MELPKPSRDSVTPDDSRGTSYSLPRSYLYPLSLFLLGAWIGSFLPISDLGYLDLNHGRRIAETGHLSPPVVKLSSEDDKPQTGVLGPQLLYFAHQLGGETGVRALAAFSVATG